jgi:hypothetical protein
MALPRFRLTVRRLLVGVAFGCLSLALFRLHTVLGILAFSMTCMALIRTYEIIDRASAAGWAIPPSRLALTFLASATVVSVILVGSFLPAMCAYELTFESIPTGCSFPTTTNGIFREHGLPTLVAVTVAYPCALMLRKNLW